MLYIQLFHIKNPSIVFALFRKIIIYKLCFNDIFVYKNIRCTHLTPFVDQSELQLILAALNQT